MENKSKWLICLIISLFAFQQHSFSQSVKRQSIGCYGSSGFAENVFISQTIGQPFFTLGHTDNQLGLTPGFLQPLNYITKQESLVPELLDLNIYPNPASENFWVKSPDIIEKAVIKITDINGRLISEELVLKFQNYRVNSSTWSEGVYFVSVSSQNNQVRFMSKVIVIK